eukprot:gene5072-5175_t
MFTAILSTAAVMAAAQGTPPVPCEPWRFQTMRLEFISDGTTLEGVYEAQ